MDAAHVLEIPIEDAKQLVSRVDFTMIRMKLADSGEGPGWSQQQLDRGIARYRKFLTLNILFPDQDIVPTGDVDEVWHAHILDTNAYARDCDALFGHMLHHFPYFGMRSDEDAADLLFAFENTKSMWQEVFGEEYASDETEPKRCKRTNCKPQKCK